MCLCFSFSFSALKTHHIIFRLAHICRLKPSHLKSSKNSLSLGIIDIGFCFVLFCFVNFSFNKITALGEQGWCSGDSTRLPPVWPGFDSRTRRHMWVEFVVGSHPCSERFFSGYSDPVFPSSKKKNNISKFQFDPELGHRATGLSVITDC